MRCAAASCAYSRTAPTRLDHGPAFEGWQTTSPGLLNTINRSSSCTIHVGSSSGAIIRTGPCLSRRGQAQARMGKSSSRRS